MQTFRPVNPSNRSLMLALCLIFEGSLLLSCTKQEEKSAPGGPKKNQPEKPKKEIPQESDPACIGPLTTEPTKAFAIGNNTYQQKGAILSQMGEDEDQTFVVGHLSDIKDAKAKNLTNLKTFAQWFNEKKVDVVAVTGDLGDSQESIEASLGALAAEVQVPILAIIGNGECKGYFNAALQNLSQKYPHVINMDLVRVFNADDASFVSLPGYYNATYIHCIDGCRYLPSDVARLPLFAAKATHKTRVLVSHGPPRMSGVKAIDRLPGGNNVGDKAMAAFLKENDIFPFGLFGNIQEAGGRAANLDGKPIAPHTLSSQLYLNAGSANSSRISMVDGSEAVGMAAILTIEGDKALYEIKRIKEDEAKAP